MNPTATIAQSKSPSQALVMSPRPTAVKSWLTVPDLASTQFHMIPAATSGMICGQEQHGAGHGPETTPRGSADERRRHESE